jgi:putative addiction module component (TIGR02574 family)
MMKADSEKGLLTAQQQQDLDRRTDSHKKGESKSYSWLEVRAQIENGREVMDKNSL